MRERDDGTYEFIGRLDRQVKIRGYRVSVEQVQQVLAMADGVEDAIVEVGWDELGRSGSSHSYSRPGILPRSGRRSDSIFGSVWRVT